VLQPVCRRWTGSWVPTLGASYGRGHAPVSFVAIRVLGQEKESGALRLLIQLPYRSSTLIAAKLAAVLAAWVLSSIPAFSALAIWRMLDGHLSAPETLNLLSGTCSTGARRRHGVVCSFGVGKCCNRRDRHARLHDWFVGAGFYCGRTSRPSRLDSPFVADPGVAYIRARSVIGGSCGGYRHGGVRLLRSGNVWMPPGVHVRTKLFRSLVCVLAAVIVFGLATQIRFSVDVTEDQRNSFPVADQRVLAKLAEPWSRRFIWRQAATALAQQYDANYAAKNPAAMAALYASDGVLGSTVRLDRAWPAGSHDLLCQPLASGARSPCDQSCRQRMSRAMAGMALPNLPSLCRTRMAIFAKSTAASSWSIDATPMDGTCASSNRACGSRPTNRRQATTACRFSAKFCAEKFKAQNRLVLATCS